MNSYTSAYLSLLENLDQHKDSLEKVDHFLHIINDDFINFLSCELIDIKVRKDFIKEVLADSLLRNLTFVLLEDHRIKDLISILDSIKKASLNRLGYEYLYIYSAKKLSEESLISYQKQLESHFNKQLIIENIVDEKMIAGLVFKYQNQIFDDSFNTKLENLKKDLKEVLDFGCENETNSLDS